MWGVSLHSQGHVHPALLTFYDFYKALAPGCRLDHRWVDGGVMGRPASDASSLTLRPRGWSRTAWLASLATASSGPVSGWQPFCPALVTWAQPPRSRCSFQRPSPGSGSLAASRAWTARVRCTGSRLGGREGASPPDPGSPGPRRGHRAEQSRSLLAEMLSPSAGSRARVSEA